MLISAQKKPKKQKSNEEKQSNNLKATANRSDLVLKNLKSGLSTQIVNNATHPMNFPMTSAKDGFNLLSHESVSGLNNVDISKENALRHFDMFSADPYRTNSTKNSTKPNTKVNQQESVSFIQEETK